MNMNTIRKNPSFPAAAGAVRLIFGILVIVAGLLFTLDNFGLVDARFILRLWPVALVAVGLTKALQRQGFWNGFWGAVIALAGVLLLLDNLRVLRFPVWKLMPLILVAIGIRLVQKAGGRTYPDRTIESRTAAKLDETAIFGGWDRSVTTNEFLGGEINAIFGGFELDLTNCRIPDDQASITVFIAFGGGDIRVPRDWAVDVKAFAIFGGTDDKSSHPPLDGDVPPKRLVIDGFVVFGGLDIKN
jgi:predicted membrane protein